MGLRTHARRAGEEGLRFNPGFSGLGIVLDSIGCQSTSAEEELVQADPIWPNVAQYLADTAILELIATGKEVRNPILGASLPDKRAIVISTNNKYENLWQHQPTWAVGMLVSQMARWRVVNNFTFGHVKALRDFLYAAFLLESYADVHEASGKYFVRFYFDPRDVENFLATPIEQNSHVNSNWIHFAQYYCFGLGLRHAGRTRQDGFNLGIWPLGIVGQDPLYAASCVNDEFVMIASLGETNFWDGTRLYEDSALFEAIRTGQELPFLLVTLSRIAGRR
jgi:hypothetical protein